MPLGLPCRGSPIRAAYHRESHGGAQLLGTDIAHPTFERLVQQRNQEMAFFHPLDQPTNTNPILTGMHENVKPPIAPH